MDYATIAKRYEGQTADAALLKGSTWDTQKERLVQVSQRTGLSIGKLLRIATETLLERYEQDEQ